MWRYVRRRLGQMIPTVVGVVLLTFVLFNVAGGDLAAIALGKNVSPQALEEFDAARGLNRPLFFGTRVKTRAFADHDFSEGAGKFAGNTNLIWHAEEGMLEVPAGTTVQLTAFPLEERSEWTMVCRAAAGFELEGIRPSADWEKVRIRSPRTEGVLTAGDTSLFIRKIELRRIQKNPFDSQLFFYVRQLLKGDLGYSSYFKQPVGKLLLDGVLPSLSLTVPIFFIGLTVSIILALLCAFFRDTFIDRFFVVASVALMSINYLVYIVAGQYVLAYRFGVAPVWGYESWRYLVLPVAIGVVSGLGSNLRFYRTVMLDEMYKEYVRTALAKGCSRSRVLFVHVLKNAMIPIITNVVIAIPFLYTGSLLLESFFGIPGLGYLGVTALNSSDIDVVRALVLIGALLFVVANLLTDLCYALADPRAKFK